MSYFMKSSHVFEGLNNFEKGLLHFGLVGSKHRVLPHTFPKALTDRQAFIDLLGGDSLLKMHDKVLSEF